MGLTMFRAEHIFVLMDTTPHDTSGHFGSQVAARLKAAGYTLRDVSAATDIPLTTLHRRLRSQSMAFTLGELTRIAALLNTTAGQLVTEFEEKAA